MFNPMLLVEMGIAEVVMPFPLIIKFKDLNQKDDLLPEAIKPHKPNPSMPLIARKKRAFTQSEIM